MLIHRWPLLMIHLKLFKNKENTLTSTNLKIERLSKKTGSNEPILMARAGQWQGRHHSDREDRGCLPFSQFPVIAQQFFL